jgi:hypothetical protein
VSAPERTNTSPPGLELLGAPPPMAPDQNPAKSSINQGKRRATRPRRLPRGRLCLLKGCGKRFRPTRALTRYCSAGCAAEGRRWSMWKAQQRYRGTKHGRRKRQAQSYRYRQRNPSHKRETECCAEEARVITPEFFRVFLRSPWLLRTVLSYAPFSTAALLRP